MKRALLVLFSLLVLYSCNMNCLNKEAFINGYNTFSTDVKEHYQEIGPSQWADIDKEFKEYVEICYPKFKEEMSINERIDFWKHTISYGFYRGDQDGSFKLDVALDYETEINELSEQARIEIEQFIRKEIKPELENVIDDILDEVESFGEKVKIWLNEQ